MLKSKSVHDYDWLNKIMTMSMTENWQKATMTALSIVDKNTHQDPAM